MSPAAQKGIVACSAVDKVIKAAANQQIGATAAKDRNPAQRLVGIQCVSQIANLEAAMDEAIIADVETGTRHCQVVGDRSEILKPSDARKGHVETDHPEIGKRPRTQRRLIQSVVVHNTAPREKAPP